MAGMASPTPPAHGGSAMGCTAARASAP